MSVSTIGVIDYKAGNAPSVLNAFLKQGLPAGLVSTKQELEKASMLVLPGVGSAKATMESLEELRLLEVLDERVNRQGVPFLGICIGLQILFSHSDEGDVNCLGWLKGRIKRFSEAQGVRIPQMGWNRVDFKDGRNPDYFYFVNAYHAIPEDENIIFATAEYGSTFCAMVKHNNITATQFHLEKSGVSGLKLLTALCTR